MSAACPPPPLRGLRVVDLTRLLPGPLATLMLADLGAEVVKVEDPLGDPVRAFPPPLVEGSSLLFHALNRGKRFVSLDLKAPADRDRLLALVARADCLVEGFRPDVLPRLGLDPRDLVRRFDRLVVARISGYGESGPWSHRAGHDLGYLALTGALHRAPTDLPLPFQAADVGAALLAASSIVAALAGRALGNGGGRVIDVPILDGALMMTFPMHARDAGGDPVAPGEGVLEGGLPVYRTWPAGADRRIAVAALEPKFHGPLESLAGGLDADSLGAAFARTPVADLEALECVEPVLSPAEARAHPAVLARASFRTLRSGGDAWQLPVTPFARDDVVPDGPWAGPIGADNETVLV